MKRAFSVFAVILLLLAAGCEKTKKEKTLPPVPPNMFSSNLEITFADTTMTAKIAKKSADEFEIQMLSPEIMESLALTYKGGICTVTYDGLRFETDLSRFPQSEFGALLTQALFDISQDIDIQKTYSNGIWTYKGNGERGVFVLTQSAETGAWLELSIEGAKLRVIFKDFNASQTQ